MSPFDFAEAEGIQRNRSITGFVRSFVDKNKICATRQKQCERKH